MSLIFLKDRILNHWCDDPGVGVAPPRLGLAGTSVRRMTNMPGASNYYLSANPPFGQLIWFTESTIQSVFYMLLVAEVAAHNWPYLVLSEQRYPDYPDNQRADLMVVDTTNNARLAVELKSDFNIDNVQNDMGKLEALANQHVIQLGVALFCAHAVQFGQWMHDLHPDPEAAVTPGGIFKD